MELAKSGAAGSLVIAAISAEWSAKACSKAGRKCSGLISSKGGVANGVTQAFSCGLVSESVFWRGSDIASPGLHGSIVAASYSMRWGFFGPFGLAPSRLFEEIAALEATDPSPH